jgi:uncharacterized protein (DUF1697 family)
MPVWIALFRGINIGGHNKVKMADLKTAFEELGFTDVRTYIQSGNVLFRSDEAEGPLRLKITQKFKETFGFAPALVLRAAAELKTLVERCPFSQEMIDARANPDFETFYVAFFPDAPDAAAAARMEAFKAEREEYRLVGRDLYILLSHSIRESKLAGYVTKLEATARNWNTVRKLYEMAEEI